MAYSPPDSSVHGDAPGKNTGVVAMPSSRGSSQLRNRMQVSLIAGRFFTVCITREAHSKLERLVIFFFSFSFKRAPESPSSSWLLLWVPTVLWICLCCEVCFLNLCSQHRDAFTCMFVFSRDLVPWEQGEKALVIFVALEFHTGFCQLHALASLCWVRFNLQDKKAGLMYSILPLVYLFLNKTEVCSAKRKFILSQIYFKD